MTKPSILDQVIVFLVALALGFTVSGLNRLADKFYSAYLTPLVALTPVSKERASTPLAPTAYERSEWEHPLGGLILIETFEGVLRPGTYEELLVLQERDEINLDIVHFADFSPVSPDQFHELDNGFDRGQILWIGRRIVYG